MTSVVEEDVVHADIRSQTLHCAVRLFHVTQAAVAAQSHRVRDGGVHTGGAVGEFKCLVVHVFICAHLLEHVEG